MCVVERHKNTKRGNKCVCGGEREREREREKRGTYYANNVSATPARTPSDMYGVAHVSTDLDPVAVAFERTNERELRHS